MNNLHSNLKNRFVANQWDLIQNVLTEGKRPWLELAEQFNIRTSHPERQRAKAANDVWRRFVRLTNTDNIDLTTVKQTFNGSGEVLFETKQLKEEIPEIHESILEGKKIKKITINPYGRPWVTYVSELEESKETLLEDFTESFKKVLEEVPVNINLGSQFDPINALFAQSKDLIVYTSDKHVGAKTETNSIYTNEYTAQEFRARMVKISDAIKVQGSVENLIIFDLGDALDGFNHQTTRGGHTLPQNLNNREQFETYLSVHKEFFTRILLNGNTYSSIKFICAANNNHGGDFDYIAMRGLELILNQIAPQIEVTITTKFIDHVVIPGKFTIIYTHGKDANDMKHGLPLILNDKVENYINQYIDYHDLRGSIIFAKGDLHQSASMNAKRFRYKNVGSIYGSSRWIHTNFGNTKPVCDMDLITPEYTSEIKIKLI